jgi:hypothetical protein
MKNKQAFSYNFNDLAKLSIKIKILISITFLVLYSLISSCSSKSDNAVASDNSSSSLQDDGISNQDSESEDNEVENESFSSCQFEDGTYSANVDYNNPETGYSATYTLDVEVQDCQLIQINFPNDGYLDEDHISMATLTNMVIQVLKERTVKHMKFRFIIKNIKKLTQVLSCKVSFTD